MYSTPRAVSRLARACLVNSCPATPLVSPRVFTATTRYPSSSKPKSRPQPRARPSAPPPPFELVPTCPSPTCECAATPAMPDGLEIDRKAPLNGVVSAYAEQVLVCTGKDDWASRIEEENSGDNLAADLKELFGRGGTYSDPWHNISVLNASFPSSTPRRSELQTASAYLLPSFKYVPFLPRVSFDSVQALAKGYLLPETLHPMHDGLSPIHRDRLTRKEAYRSLLYGVRDVTDVLVLVCGHGGRDMRCGVMGPVLRDEFEARLEGAGVHVARGPVEVDESGGEAQRITPPEGGKTAGRGGIAARVGLISHIGGHKFAGNVIVYLPPGLRTKGGEAHPLAGKGIWYGRVEPKHVEGIVYETVLGGRVIADMFRGGIDENRKILRL
ncbi:Sucrase/ferredoxin-like-domain-containing protein [Colletotrichum cereale]|nr:Sucrase/ferredoxin-like-domain-containing protein [Colletotrichum cereale]